LEPSGAFWTHPGLSADHKARVKQLYEGISRGGSRNA